MKKEKNKMWKSFFINVLGVIVGIMLTFGGNALWQKREEKKRTKEILILVRNELNGSKKWFIDQEKSLNSDRYVCKKILEAKGDWTTIPKDTLCVYRDQMIEISFTHLTTSSWQIFQNSDIIQKMSDKYLVIRLAECYFWIEKAQEMIIKKYWDIKDKYAKVFERDPHLFFDAVMLNKESRFYYEEMGLEDNSFEGLFWLVDTYIDYTIMLLDEHGDYIYNDNEKAIDMVSFFQARYDSVFHKNIKINLNIENQ